MKFRIQKSKIFKSISNIQGMYLLTHTFKDPKLASRQSDSIKHWLESLVDRKVTTTAAPVSAEAVAG